MATKAKALKVGDKVVIKGVVTQVATQSGPYVLTHVELQDGVIVALEEKHMQKEK